MLQRPSPPNMHAAPRAAGARVRCPSLPLLVAVAAAAATAGEIKRLAPNFSIKTYMAGLSFSDPAVLQRMESGMRKAGLH